MGMCEFIYNTNSQDGQQMKVLQMVFGGLVYRDVWRGGWLKVTWCTVEYTTTCGVQTPSWQ